VSGLDAAAPLLDIARERVPAASLTVGDLEDPLPCPEGAFDVITSFNSVQYAADPVAAIKGMSHVTRPGGLVSFLVWGPPEKCESGVMFTELGPLMPPAPPATPGAVAWSEEGQLEKLAELAGLTCGHRRGRTQPADLPRPRDGGPHPAQLRPGPQSHPALRPSRGSRRADTSVRHQPPARRHLPAEQRLPLPHRPGLTGTAPQAVILRGWDTADQSSTESAESAIGAFGSFWRGILISSLRVLFRAGLAGWPVRCTHHAFAV
jgi:SAM-dependent methyltransferase